MYPESKKEKHLERYQGKLVVAQGNGMTTVGLLRKADYDEHCLIFDRAIMYGDETGAVIKDDVQQPGMDKAIHTITEEEYKRFVEEAEIIKRHAGTYVQLNQEDIGRLVRVTPAHLVLQPAIVSVFGRWRLKENPTYVQKSKIQKIIPLTPDDLEILVGPMVPTVNYANEPEEAV